MQSCRGLPTLACWRERTWKPLPVRKYSLLKYLADDVNAEREKERRDESQQQGKGASQQQKSDKK